MNLDNVMVLVILAILVNLGILVNIVNLVILGEKMKHVILGQYLAKSAIIIKSKRMIL